MDVAPLMGVNVPPAVSDIDHCHDSLLVFPSGSVNVAVTACPAVIVPGSVTAPASSMLVTVTTTLMSSSSSVSELPFVLPAVLTLLSRTFTVTL